MSVKIAAKIKPAAKIKSAAKTKKPVQPAQSVNVLSRGVRLTDKDKAQLIKLHKTGQYTQHALAAHFGCSYGTVWGIVGSGVDYAERVAAHGGALRTEAVKTKKRVVSSNLKTSALSRIKKPVR